MIFEPHAEASEFVLKNGAFSTSFLDHGAHWLLSVSRFIDQCFKLSLLYLKTIAMGA